jgi:hypothetical protein
MAQAEKRSTMCEEKFARTDQVLFCNETEFPWQSMSAALRTARGILRQAVEHYDDESAEGNIRCKLALRVHKEHAVTAAFAWWRGSACTGTGFRKRSSDGFEGFLRPRDSIS